MKRRSERHRRSRLRASDKSLGCEVRCSKLLTACPRLHLKRYCWRILAIHRCAFFSTTPHPRVFSFYRAPTAQEESARILIYGSVFRCLHCFCFRRFSRATNDDWGTISLQSGNAPRSLVILLAGLNVIICVAMTTLAIIVTQVVALSR